MAELADEELRGVVPKLVEDEVSNEWKDIGYYKDANGKMHFGVKPDKDTMKLPGYRWKHDYDDLSRNRTSNPMYY